jgi:flagellar basal body-associated protein FliL
LFTIISIVILLVSFGLAGYIYIEKNLLVTEILANQKTIEEKDNAVAELNTEIVNIKTQNDDKILACDLYLQFKDYNPSSNLKDAQFGKLIRFNKIGFKTLNKQKEVLENKIIQLINMDNVQPQIINRPTVQPSYLEVNRLNDNRRFYDQPIINNPARPYEKSIDEQRRIDEQKRSIQLRRFDAEIIP